VGRVACPSSLPNRLAKSHPPPTTTTTTPSLVHTQELLFFNSLKMKMSVILGITQMTFGLILKVLNAIHYKSATDLWLEAIPQVWFMVSLFGYMIFLIMFKWSINWRDGSAPCAPPSLIDTMINIALKPGTVLPADTMFDGQAAIQVGTVCGQCKLQDCIVKL
jgi:vacuolar-type H+-ATPase subunit I/STV1